MSSNYEKVLEFHRAFGHPIEAQPGFPTEDLIKLRTALIDEEFNVEFKEAVEARDIVAVADALTDILYVVYGAGAVYGIDLDATYAEVHRSNMTKLGADGKPVLREDGKILKGPNYEPPNLTKVLFGD